MAPRFVIASLAGLALLLAAAAAINIAVDPFQQYRVPGYEARFYRSYQRYENPGIARHYDYDRAIVASSFFENISGSEVDRAFGRGKTMNLCESAMSAYDARKLLEAAFERGNVKEVLYGMDYSAFAGGIDRPGYGDTLPLYMYDASRWNDYPYVLSLVTLRKSLDILAGRTEEGYRTDRDAPWYWAQGVVFSARKVVDNVDPYNINLRYQQPQRTLPGMMASFEANVVPLVRDHPQTQFIFAWPPYSVIAWIDYVQRGQLDVSLEFKRRFVEAMSRYPNVRIYDFQERGEWIGDLDQYRDIYHFSPAISSQLVKDIAADRDRLTPGNVEARNAEMRRIATTADLARIMAEARAKPR
jgi:hypothetical protein